jgi:hypothetical protein
MAAFIELAFTQLTGFLCDLRASVLKKHRFYCNRPSPSLPVPSVFFSVSCVSNFRFSMNRIPGF